MRTSLVRALRRALVIATLGVAPLALTACGTGLSYTHITASPTPMHSRRWDTVQVFLTGRPTWRYVEVGLIEAQQESAFASGDTRDLVRDMRQFAAERGCDGLIIVSAADTVQGNLYGVNTLHGFRGSCVMFAGR